MAIKKKPADGSQDGAAHRQYLLFGSLFAILALSVCGLTVAFAMFKLPQISVHGWIAMGLGTIFSLIVGCGLMALAFFSARAGYDDRADQGRRGPAKLDQNRSNKEL
jgi:hypothetical protein